MSEAAIAARVDLVPGDGEHGAMPIVDVEIVAGEEEVWAAARGAGALADVLGKVFATAAGRTWVRLRTLPASAYAENESRPGPGEWPVFVTVLHAHPPTGEARAAEVMAVTTAVAAWAGRAPERIHVQYAPAAAGRQAFGGRLVE